MTVPTNPSFINSNSIPAKLRQPGADEIAHSNALIQHILDELSKTRSGKMPFSEFMELALYAPGLGYYSAGNRKFGKDGDFVTAPEISALFAQCLARQCQQVLSKTTEAIILEFGAGTGALAADLLLSLELLKTLPKNYWIIEISAELKARQQQTLQDRCPHLVERVQWLSRLPQEAFNGVIIANEVLDAMPVNLFHWNGNTQAIQEVVVTWQDDQFKFNTVEPITPNLIEAVQHIQQDLNSQSQYISSNNNANESQDVWPASYTSEVNLLLTPWLTSVTQYLQQGLVLLIDYGFKRISYYHPQRHTGTLMCHYRHHAHVDPLILLGLQDITAHVDFTAVAEAAVAAELTVSGYTSQANFLLNCGITELIPTSDDVKAQYDYAQQIKMLTMPSEMGELFKVIALSQQFDDPLLGFNYQTGTAAGMCLISGASYSEKGGGTYAES